LQPFLRKDLKSKIGVINMIDLAFGRGLVGLYEYVSSMFVIYFITSNLSHSDSSYLKDTVLSTTAYRCGGNLGETCKLGRIKDDMRDLTDMNWHVY
jgi:hypothetical protein